MPFRAWLIIGAIGLTFSVMSGSAQEIDRSAVEGNPTSEARQDEGSVIATDQKQNELLPRFGVFGTLKGIEDALRDMIVEEGDFERQRQQDRESRDLIAQEEMAFWAKGMFWATCATVILTLAALATIVMTLYFTKVAAAHSADMVEITRQTSVSAAESLRVTREMGKDAREIGIKQVRANLYYYSYTVRGTDHMQTEQDVVIQLAFKNFGATPAKDIAFDLMDQSELVRSNIVGPNGSPLPPTFRNFDESKVRGKTLRFCGPGETVESHLYAFDRSSLVQKSALGPFFYLAGWLRYKDDFWLSERDYRYCKFCFLVQHANGLRALNEQPPSRETIQMKEHGPDNFSV